MRLLYGKEADPWILFRVVQSFGSAISVVSGEEGGRVDIVGGQYHTPVSQEQVVHLAQQGVRQGKRNSKNISPLEQR